MTKGESLNPPCKRNPYGGPPARWNANRWHVDISAASAHVTLAAVSSASAAAAAAAGTSYSSRDTKLNLSKDFGPAESRGFRTGGQRSCNWFDRSIPDARSVGRSAPTSKLQLRAALEDSWRLGKGWEWKNSSSCSAEAEWICSALGRRLLRLLLPPLLRAAAVTYYSASAPDRRRPLYLRARTYVRRNPFAHARADRRPVRRPCMDSELFDQLWCGAGLSEWPDVLMLVLLPCQRPSVDTNQSTNNASLPFFGR